METTDSLLREDIREKFEAASDSPAVLEACLSMCKTYHLDPEELSYRWDAHIYNSDASMAHLTEDRLSGFRDYLQRELRPAVNKRDPGKLAGPSTPARTQMGAPRAAKSALAARMLASNVKTPQSAMRMNVKAEPMDIGLSSDPPKASLNAGSRTANRVIPSKSTQDYSYRYMYETILEHGDALNTRIDQVSSYVKDFYQVEDGIGDPGAVTEEEIIVVGRIIENEDEEKTSEYRFLLEPSRQDGSGRRIPLRLHPNLQFHPFPGGAKPARSNIDLFPGGIAAFKGVTSHGTDGPFFLARETLVLPPLPPPNKTKAIDLSFTVIIAVGPFTHDKDLEYGPFVALLQLVRQVKPQALILMGPFVDSHHSVIRSGKAGDTFDGIFVKNIASPLVALLKEIPGLSVAFMPHVRDLVSFWNVYPQSAELSPGARSRNPSPPSPAFTYLSNPSRFTIHGIKFAATSADVLFQLNKKAARTPVPGNLPPGRNMTELCQAVLDQRSFYPLYPVPLEFSGDMNLDVPHMHLLSIGEDTPDIFIFPSRLKEFSKTVSGCVFVNPSCTSKAMSNGTIAKVTVNAMAQGSERISVDLIKV